MSSRKRLGSVETLELYDVVRVYADGTVGDAGLRGVGRGQAVQDAAACVKMLADNPDYRGLPEDIIGYAILPAGTLDRLANA